LLGCSTQARLGLGARGERVGRLARPSIAARRRYIGPEEKVLRLGIALGGELAEALHILDVRLAAKIPVEAMLFGQPFPQRVEDFAFDGIGGRSRRKRHASR
jgi:hypothetical protein